MCQLTQKLALSNYIIDKWAEMQARKDQSSDVISMEDKKIAIQKFSTTHFMKLLYFTCLESARGENGTIKSPNLFKYFNDFRAYGNGPVEQTIYDHKEQMPTISKNEKFQYKLDKTEQDLVDYIIKDGLIDYKKMIDDSITALTNDNGKSIPFAADDDIEKLVWISHGELWNIAQFAEGKKLIVDEDYFLKKELEEFDKRKKYLMINYKPAI